jgi:UDP-N-acetylmuramate dehydrogenase
MKFKIINSFGISGTARDFINIENIENVGEDLEGVNPAEIRILGGGYNSIPLEHFDGTYIRVVDKKSSIKDLGIEIELTANSGMAWDDLVALSVSSGGKGLENLSLIPGDVGTAPIHNIGAYGREVSEFIQKVYCYDLDLRRPVIFDNSECLFDYRSSIFKSRDRLLITKVVFRFRKRKLADYFEVNKVREFISLFIYSLTAVEFFKKGRIVKISFDRVRDILKLDILSPKIKRFLVIKIRKKILLDPDVIGNCGCFFKCPIITEGDFQKISTVYPDVEYHKHGSSYKLSACWLLRGAGWAGKEVGGVMPDVGKPVMLLNKTGASADSVRFVVKSIQEDIMNKFGIKIEPEVVLVE